MRRSGQQECLVEFSCERQRRKGCSCSPSCERCRDGGANCDEGEAAVAELAAEETDERQQVTEEGVKQQERVIGPRV